MLQHRDILLLSSYILYTYILYSRRYRRWRLSGWNIKKREKKEKKREKNGITSGKQRQTDRERENTII